MVRWRDGSRVSKGARLGGGVDGTLATSQGTSCVDILRAV